MSIATPLSADEFFRDAKGRPVALPQFACVPSEPFDAKIGTSLLMDGHTHLGSLRDPVSAIVQCAQVRMGFLCNVLDPTEDGPRTYANIQAWFDEASARLMREGRSAVVPRYRIAAGIHPHNAKLATPGAYTLLEYILADPRTCAIGEIGLDYHYDFSPRDAQKEVFARQLRMAHELGMPVVMHIREAHEDALEILRREGVPSAGALVHCFTSGPDVCREYIELECYFSLGGAVTFKTADEVRESAKIIPADRLIVETDAPYMAPVPLRGTKSTPAMSVLTLRKLMDVRGVESEREREFAERLMQSTLTLLDQKLACHERLRVDARGASDKQPLVAVLVGSPRHGITEQVAEGAIEGLASQGVLCEEFYLANAGIKPCVECDSCIETGGDCVFTGTQGDAMAQLDSLLDRADALLLATPIFFAGPPSQLKALFDRMQPRWSRRYVHGDAARQKRPMHLLMTGTGGDPYGCDALVTIVRSAMAIAGFRAHDKASLFLMHGTEERRGKAAGGEGEAAADAATPATPATPATSATPARRAALLGDREREVLECAKGIGVAFAAIAKQAASGEWRRDNEPPDVVCHNWRRHDDD